MFRTDHCLSSNLKYCHRSNHESQRSRRGTCLRYLSFYSFDFFWRLCNDFDLWVHSSCYLSVLKDLRTRLHHYRTLSVVNSALNHFSFFVSFCQSFLVYNFASLTSLRNLEGTVLNHQIPGTEICPWLWDSWCVHFDQQSSRSQVKNWFSYWLYLPALLNWNW